MLEKRNNMSKVLRRGIKLVWWKPWGDTCEQARCSPKWKGVTPFLVPVTPRLADRRAILMPLFLLEGFSYGGRGMDIQVPRFSGYDSNGIIIFGMAGRMFWKFYHLYHYLLLRYNKSYVPRLVQNISPVQIMDICNSKVLHSLAILYSLPFENLAQRLLSYILWLSKNRNHLNI